MLNNCLLYPRFVVYWKSGYSLILTTFSFLGANIFVSSSGLIKIGDFGSAVKLKDALATSQGEVFSTRGTAGGCYRFFVNKM